MKGNSGRYYNRALLMNPVKEHLQHILQDRMTVEHISEILKLPYMLIYEMYKRSAFIDKSNYYITES
jgi:hypothetical protein